MQLKAHTPAEVLASCASIRESCESTLAKVAAARAEVEAFPHLAGQVFLAAAHGLVVTKSGEGYRLGGAFWGGAVAFPATALDEAANLGRRWNHALDEARYEACAVTVTPRADVWAAMEAEARSTLAMVEEAEAKARAEAGEA